MSEVNDIIMGPPILKNKYSGEIFRILSSPFTIGRGLRSDVVIATTCISRMHCSFHNNNGVWRITDSSTNGTVVNGVCYKLMTTPVLKHNDEIILAGNGIYTYTFLLDDYSYRSPERLQCNQQEAYVTSTNELEAGPSGSTIVIRNPTNVHKKVKVSCLSTNVENICNETNISSSQINSLDARESLIPVPAYEVSVKNTLLTAGPSLQQPSTSITCEEKQEPAIANENRLETMEDELTCTICANLFIKAVTLGCSHSFCEYCIETWKRKKSKCPICRDNIKSIARTLVLDNVIEKVLECATQDVKDQRKQAIEDREKVEESGTNKKHKNKRRVNTRSFPIQPAVVVIHDTPPSNEEDSDSFSEISEEYYDDDEDGEAVPGYYYGGYGRCYVCRRMGHWANGCPYR